MCANKAEKPGKRTALVCNNLQCHWGSFIIIIIIIIIILPLMLHLSNVLIVEGFSEVINL